MRLEELKSALVEQFFSDSTNGVKLDQLESIFKQLGEQLKSDLACLVNHEVDLAESRNEGTSAEPSKAFKKFTDGRRSVLAIIEGDGSDSRAIFAAARSGKKIAIMNLTNEEKVSTNSDLASIKAALKQAKNHSDDAYFSITNDDN